MSDSDDRRRGDRVVINREFGSLDAGTITYVNNLSAHGLFLHTDERVPIGTTVELRFTVLLDDPVPIEGLATVVRHQDDPSGMGLTFGPLSPKTVLRIQDVLARQRPVASGEPVTAEDEPEN
ncbi:MAG: hypothetical protein B7733_22030 [Myxococcales bacterium FL481]|nr:MAG: hypothetical protein B7733_22030 [Myxococcales bacterium FL481]